MVLCEVFLVFQIDVYAVPVQFGFGNIITTYYNFEFDDQFQMFTFLKQ